MSRRHAAEKREVLPDAKYGDRVLTKFMNNLMVDGKKSVAEKIVYNALDRVQGRLKREPIEVFHEAMDNVKPSVEVRSRRVGGATELVVQVVDVDEVLEVGQPQLHHRDQAVPAGDEPGLLAEPVEQPDGVLDTRGALVVERCGDLHGAPRGRSG